jgi:hypothetical protein
VSRQSFSLTFVAVVPGPAFRTLAAVKTVEAVQACTTIEAWAAIASGWSLCCKQTTAISAPVTATNNLPQKIGASRVSIFHFQTSVVGVTSEQ